MAHNKRSGIRAGRLLGLRSSDDLGDGGDAARAGGKGSGVVAGGVLDGVGVVAGGGVGVGDDNSLALADGRWSDTLDAGHLSSSNVMAGISVLPVPEAPLHSPKGRRARETLFVTQSSSCRGPHLSPR